MSTCVGCHYSLYQTYKKKVIIHCIMPDGFIVQVPVLTTIGFLKDAPHVNIHGFNVYHRNRLILVSFLFRNTQTVIIIKIVNPLLFLPCLRYLISPVFWFFRCLNSDLNHCATSRSIKMIQLKYWWREKLPSWHLPIATSFHLVRNGLSEDISEYHGCHRGLLERTMHLVPLRLASRGKGLGWDVGRFQAGWKKMLLVKEKKALG